jgi:trehalose transport system substrate-binding protein
MHTKNKSSKQHGPTNVGITQTTAAVIVAVIIVVGVVAGVGVYFATRPRPTTAVSSVTVNLYDDTLAPSEINFFKTTLIPEFEQAYPNISVNLVVESASDMVNTIEALVQGNDVGPTLIIIDNLVIGELLFGNYLTNITSYSSSILPGSLIPSMQNLVGYEQKAFGGVFFVPFRGNIPLVWYNKTLFNQLGISPPSNWAQLLQDSQMIYQKTGVKPVMFQGHGGASTYTELYQWMVQAGGNPFLFNDSGDVLAMQYLYNLSAYFSPNYIHGYWGNYKGLANGEYYILDYQWPYIYSAMASEGINVSKIGFYPGPQGPSNGDHLVGGDVLAIPRGATDVPAILHLANFLLSTQAQHQLITMLAEPAVNAQAYSNLPANVSALYTAEEDAFQTAFFREPVPWITEWGTIADQVFTQIIVNHAPYSQIPSILSLANQQMYNYLASNYNSTVAQQYEDGYYTPLYG